jgi:type II secretory pathway pseudopilin PulG
MGLVEAVISILIVSIMIVAALQTVGAARTADARVAERGRGLLLAQGLMAEILQQAYADPQSGLGSFGAEETATNRSLFDDVDDYNGWQASPPQNKAGTPIAWATGYEEQVSVAWVDPTAGFAQSASATGVKRIVVSINRGNRTVVTLTAYRTQAWQDPGAARGALP